MGQAAEKFIADLVIGTGVDRDNVQVDNRGGKYKDKVPALMMQNEDCALLMVSGPSASC